MRGSLRAAEIRAASPTISSALPELKAARKRVAGCGLQSEP